MNSHSMMLFLTTDCSSVAETKEWNLGQFYLAFQDLNIFLNTSGLNFLLEFGMSENGVELYVDCNNDLILKICPKFFNFVFNITHSTFCKISLNISYSGIRNYELLFPYFNNKKLLKRIVQFYEEADIAYENKAWLSYVLMAGAVLEGLLFDIVGENLSFNKLIEQAYNQKYITRKMKNIIIDAKNMRNMVHSNKYNK